MYWSKAGDQLQVPANLINSKQLNRNFMSFHVLFNRIYFFFNFIMNSVISGKESKRVSTLKRQLYTSIVVEKANEISFGKYIQSGNSKSLLSWRVLKVEEDKALLITKYCIDCKRYNQKYEHVTWKKCSLRNWLNTEFFFNTFNFKERAVICEKTIPITENSKFNTNSKFLTTDRVFLLSLEDAQELFSSNEERRAKATEYAKNKDVHVNQSSFTWWWLRTPGVQYDHACHVFIDGSIHFAGHNVDMDVDAVRPAIWVKYSP